MEGWAISFNPTWHGYNMLEARFERVSTVRFSNLGTWAMMNFANPTTTERTKVRHCAIRSFLPHILLVIETLLTVNQIEIQVRD